MKRPKFLTIWLIIMMISLVTSLYSYTLGSQAIANLIPSWALTAYSLLVVINLFSVVMIWMWHKIGFYILVGSSILAAVLNGYTLGSPGIFASLFAIIGLAILYYLMKPVWQNFK